MPLSTRQKGEVLEQFMDMTNRQLDRNAAQKILRNCNYQLGPAFDQFLSQSSTSTAPLEHMFDQLRNPNRDPDKNLIEAESMMEYLDGMDVNGENFELFVLLEIVRAPGFGQISRQGFIDGWRDTTAAPTAAAHKRYIKDRIQQLPRDADLFKRVYRYAFVAGKDTDQKALQLERALVYWDMLFADEVHPWRSANVDWLALWKRFLDEKWTRSVNKDMWNQTLEFANKSMADEKLTFWSEDSAWPGVIDDFVAWVKENGTGSDGMQVD